MLHNENYKISAKSMKPDEAVSDNDTARMGECFVAEF